MVKERTISVKRKLVRANLLLVLLPIVIFSVVLYSTMKTQIKKESLEKNAKVLSQIAQNIDTVVESAINLTNLYYFDQAMIDTLGRLDDMTLVEKMQHRTQLEERFLYHNIILGYKGCYTAVFDRHGNDFFKWNRIGYDFKFFDLQDMIKNFNEKTSNRLIWIGEQIQNVRFFNEEKQVFFVVRQLKAPYSNHHLGTLILGIDEEVLYERYEGMMEKGEDIFILNENGVVISTKDKSCLGKPLENRYLKADSKDFFVNVEKLKQSGWSVVQVIPQENLLSPLKNVYPLMFFTISICLVLSTWLSYHLAMGIATPIIGLTKFVHSLDGDHLNSYTEPTSIDEIRDLAKGFNNLTQRLQESIKALILAEREKRKAEYEMLQAKINPHFLFNTLSTVRCLITQKELAKSNEILISLGKLLRDTLGGHDEVATIGEELDRLNHYLLIQKMRYQDRFIYKIEVDLEVYHCQIIQLVLQPVVENAIFHGGEQEGYPMEICIRGSIVEKAVLLTIKDTGSGMSQKRIKEIMDKNHVTPKYLFSGVGLRNIIDRIDLYYGYGYGLWIESEEGMGTTVFIRIPQVVNKGGVWDEGIGGR